MRKLCGAWLVLCLFFSLLVVPTSAASVPPKNVIYDSSFVSALDVPFGRISLTDAGITKQWLWEWFSTPVNNYGIGQVSPDQLRIICNSLNTWFSRGSFSGLGSSSSGPETSILVEIALNGVFGAINGGTVFTITEHAQYGEVIMMETASGWYYVCNAQGAFPYSPIEYDEENKRTLGGLWLPYDEVDWGIVNLITEFSLYDIASALRDIGDDNDVVAWEDMGSPKYQYIRSRWMENQQYLVYCDSRGNPFVYQPDPSQWASNSSNNYFTNNDGDNIYNDGPTENNKLLDLENNVIWFPDGTLQYITNKTYNDNSKTYQIDARSYDITNNTYVTNNYHYEFHINYTSVTYIGQTEEYNKTYEFYYELPDGRNSADLTAEELQALNISIDVVPYIRSADNTAIRALYHFDANTRDSSFWSYAGGLTWTQGASLTYMDAGEFNGALYLDEGNHDFTIQLPSAIGTTDFTMQFRLYHSSTLTPQTDSYIYFGDTKVAYFTGAAWGLGTSGTGSPASPGNWCEVALIRHNKVLYLYINGLCVANSSNSTSYPDSIRFSFGSSQQTYKYFDELRVLNYALVEGGSSYEPTAVPHDTNLTLVLPDSMVPVADEYWSFNTEGNLLPVYDLTEYLANSKVAQKVTESDVYYNSVSRNYWVYSNTGLSLGYANGAFGFTSSSAYSISAQNALPNGFFFPLIHYDADNGRSMRSGLKAGSTYTFTAITRDGESYSLSFKLPTSRYDARGVVSVDIPGGASIRAVTTWPWSESGLSCYLAIYPPSKGTVEFVYLELVEGEANTGHEFVSAVAPVDTDFKTPTLAVRTDLTITGYQIGGVRPSLPTKGLVWALIESGRISSLQIYNGQAWEQVDGRIWTGSRWVPYYAYDVLLLKDLYDIVESDPTLNPIYTQAGFWAWLQEAWGEMMDKLDQIIAALGGSSGSDDLTVQLPGGEDDPNTDEDDSWTVITLVTELKDGVWRVVTGVITVVYDGVVSVVDGIDAIDGFFSVYDPSSSNTIFAVAIEEG